MQIQESNAGSSGSPNAVEKAKRRAQADFDKVKTGSPTALVALASKNFDDAALEAAASRDPAALYAKYWLALLSVTLSRSRRRLRSNTLVAGCSGTSRTFPNSQGTPRSSSASKQPTRHAPHTRLCTLLTAVYRSSSTRTGLWIRSLRDSRCSTGAPSRSSPEVCQLTARSQQHEQRDAGLLSLNDRFRALREAGLGGVQPYPPPPPSADRLQEYTQSFAAIEAALPSALSSQSKSVALSSRVSENNPPPPVTPPAPAPPSTATPSPVLSMPSSAQRISKPGLPKTQTLKPKHLKILLESDLKVLVLDIRTRAAFDARHMRASPGDPIVCIEPIILQRDSLTGASVESALVIAPSEESVSFRIRSRFDSVILYDEDSLDAGPPTAPMARLVRAIYEDEMPHKRLKVAPYVLEGGLKAWEQEFGEAAIIARVPPKIAKIKVEPPPAPQRTKPVIQTMPAPDTATSRRTGGAPSTTSGPTRRASIVQLESDLLRPRTRVPPPVISTPVVSPPPAPLPSVNGQPTASSAGSSSTSDAGNARPEPAIVRCNFVSMTDVRRAPITGEFLLDPTIDVPGSRLAPLAPGESRKNFMVKVDYDVDIDVWVKSSPEVCCARVV